MEKMSSSSPYAFILMCELIPVLTTYMGQCHQCKTNIIFQYSHFARWYCTPTPLFHLTPHAYLLLIPLLKYPQSYIELDSTTLFSIFFVIKWYCTPICFDLSWLVRFLASVIEPWLLHMMVVASSCIQPTSFIRCLSKMASLVHWFMAMYTASIVDCAIICCCLLFHKMAPSPIKITYPEVDLWFSTPQAQSASE